MVWAERSRGSGEIYFLHWVIRLGGGDTRRYGSVGPTSYLPSFSRIDLLASRTYFGSSLAIPLKLPHQWWFNIVASLCLQLLIMTWNIFIKFHFKLFDAISWQSWEWQLFSSVQFSWSAASNSLWLHGLQQARYPCPSSTPGACSNSGPSSWWCHPTVLSSVVPFSYYSDTEY